MRKTFEKYTVREFRDRIYSRIEKFTEVRIPNG